MPISLNAVIAPGHAAKRAYTRHGLVLTVPDLRKMFLDITDAVIGIPSALMLKKFGSGVECWLVKAQNRPVRVIYSPDSAKIITVLPDYGH